MLKSLILLAIAITASAKKCHDLTIPLQLTSQNAVFDIKAPETEVEVTNFMLQFLRHDSNYAGSLQKNTTTIKGNYNIAATYCEPDNGPGHALQIMTHGVGFDRSYWDLPFKNYSYSYVNRAVDEQGYSTFTWDRLGVGHSSKGDPIKEIQIFLELAALKELTTQLRDGRLQGVPVKYSKTVHIGHSFGSILTYNLINDNPTITEGAVLTGFSQSTQYLVQFGLGGNFAPVKENLNLALTYPTGYVAPRSSIGFHINFFAPGDFDNEMLDYGSVNGQPASLGELLTLGVGVGSPNVYAGPVLIITGDLDIPFCGGNCGGNNASPNLIAASKPNFKNASVFNATIIPGAGHGLNMGYSIAKTYPAILDFINTHV